MSNQDLSGHMVSFCSGFNGLVINPLHAKFFRGNINIYSYFVSFLHIDTIQVVEILPQKKTRIYQFYIVNIMAADVLAR